MRAHAALLVVTLATSPAYAFDDSMARAPNLGGPGAKAACIALEHKASQVGKPKLVPLDQLPPALLEHAILRTVEGCPVREVVYQGHTYWAGSLFKAIPRFEAQPGS